MKEKQKLEEVIESKLWVEFSLTSIRQWENICANVWRPNWGKAHDVRGEAGNAALER